MLETVQPADALASINFTFKVTSTSGITMQVQGVNQAFIGMTYTTPSGNDPVGYSNNLFVWQGGPQIPWQQPPVANAAAAMNQAIVNGAFGANPYIVGYSVGPSVATGSGSGKVVTYPNIAATAAISADWRTVTYSSSTLAPANLSTSLAQFLYALPAGFSPSTAGSWIGLWDGTINPYNTSQTPIGVAPISSSLNAGTAAMMIGGPGLPPSGSYTAVLFTSGYSATPSNLQTTAIAYIVQFTTSTPQAPN